LPGVAYPGVRDNRSTINTKTGYDDDDERLRIIYIMEIMMLNSRTKEATRYNEKKSHLLTANNINSSTMSVNITVV